MTVKNLYATLADFRELHEISATDTARDTLIEKLIADVSRYIDARCGRVFYPYIKTAYYDYPTDAMLYLGEDLLSVIELKNGDGSTMTTSDYHLVPRNAPPYYAIKTASTISWTYATEPTNAISVKGWWGYHNDYGNAWYSLGTVTVNSSDLTINISGTLPARGDIVRMDDEIVQVASSSAGTFTVYQRGDNGSTAAAHTSATVYAYRPMRELRGAVLEMTNNVFTKRFGEGQMAATVTAAGVVLTPRDETPEVANVIKILTKRY
ncbi:MAG: hypothetical protein ACOY4M_08370 [Pseudomonadota bacterium]